MLAICWKLLDLEDGGTCGGRACTTKVYIKSSICPLPPPSFCTDECDLRCV